MPLKNPILATLLSIVIPGAGQVYNKQKFKAIIGYSAFLFFPIAFTMLRLGQTFWGLMSLPLFLLVLYSANVLDACLVAIRSRKKEAATHRPWLAVIPVVLLFIYVYGAIQHVRNPDHSAVGFKAVRLATNSMAPTVQVGDSFIMSTKKNEIHELKRGEIVSFFHHGLKATLFKRLIAMSGDLVEGRGTEVYVNGKKLHEPYTQYTGKSGRDDFNREHKVNDFGPIRVPADTLFVMGDNRDDSFDSRDPKFGFVDIKAVHPDHKLLYIYWSVDKSRIGQKIK